MPRCATTAPRHSARHGGQAPTAADWLCASSARFTLPAHKRSTHSQPIDRLYATLVKRCQYLVEGVKPPALLTHPVRTLCALYSAGARSRNPPRKYGGNRSWAKSETLTRNGKRGSTTLLCSEHNPPQAVITSQPLLPTNASIRQPTATSHLSYWPLQLEPPLSRGRVVEFEALCRAPFALHRSLFVHGAAYPILLACSIVNTCKPFCFDLSGAVKDAPLHGLRIRVPPTPLHP
ncbi:hypothetical protein CDD82_4237 [Ophiocordyceps australis]|uniref:Uncharacterized protein n=1 Tax=Ophiocordyceps australis TaxID=1399860 RepID=A0A2C5Z7N4_9HYPO|nr:hypothetical protein CDD82_4237 [Ophiocordyceps australis]